MPSGVYVHKKMHEDRTEYKRTYTRDLRKKRLSEGLCGRCGKAAKPGRTVCQDCVDASRDARQKAKKMAITYLGGKCTSCGLDTQHISVYDFHHMDPTEKERNISILLGKLKWEDAILELEKCTLLCANCHRILHEKGEE